MYKYQKNNAQQKNKTYKFSKFRFSILHCKNTHTQTHHVTHSPSHPIHTYTSTPFQVLLGQDSLAYLCNVEGKPEKHQREILISKGLERVKKKKKRIKGAQTLTIKRVAP